MGMPDLITSEQFVIYNCTPRVSGKALEAFIHQQNKKKKKKLFDLIFDKDYCCPLRQTILIGATSSKFHNIQIDRILFCCIILSQEYLI